MPRARAATGRHTELPGGIWLARKHVGTVLAAPPTGSITHLTLQGDHVMTDDLARDPRFTAPDPILTEHSVASGLCVPIHGKRGVLGLVGAYVAERRAFGESDLRFLEGLSHVLAAAMERKRNEAELPAKQEQVEHLQRLELVGQLAAGLAHDYNNILTIIHGHVTLALGEPGLAPPIATALKTALQASEGPPV